MKMSDVFELPVECIGTEIEDQFCKVFDAHILRPYDSNDAIESAKAAAHAINMHDDLVDALQLMRETFENAGNVVDHDYAIAMATADELLARAKGES